MATIRVQYVFYRLIIDFMRIQKATEATAKAQPVSAPHIYIHRFEKKSSCIKLKAFFANNIKYS